MIVFRFTKIQCVLFEGNDRDEFLDGKEYSGPLYEQIKGVYHPVLRHISRDAEINGLLRKKRYELPVGTIYKMIINTQCHLSFMDSPCVQVTLFDDRLEITSPGMLYGGSTPKGAVNGHSKIRNRAIAGIFSRMELIEGWGTGIRRVIKRAEEYRLRTPEFTRIGDTLRVNLLCREGRKSIKADEKPLSEERRQLIKKYIHEHGCTSSREAKRLLNLAESTAKRLPRQMVLDDYPIRQGEKESRIYRLCV